MINLSNSYSRLIFYVFFYSVRHNCAINQFSCIGSGKCIPSAWRCDNDNDCKDGSDELNCDDVKPECDREQFQCLNKNCIEKVFLCNGHDNCGDNSDEEDCPTCHPGFVSCPSDSHLGSKKTTLFFVHTPRLLNGH